MSRLVGYIQELADSLEDWERYRKIPAARFQTDRDTRNMVLHAMLLAIQSAIDIATEVIVLKAYKRPASYRETFGILEANGKRNTVGNIVSDMFREQHKILTDP
ncbi:MAG TPA: DUF86 domain-containing protein [Methanoregulaceae archaeon]|nr:DUF86 domain-containing protein [Methanoregulaceae archaeon]